MTNYNVKGTGLSVSDEIRTYIEKQLAHLDKFIGDDPTAHADVELQHQITEDRPRFRTELTLSCGSKLYRAEAFGDTLREAIDLAQAQVRSELGRTKEKRLNMVRRGALRFKDFVRGFRSRF